MTAPNREHQATAQTDYARWRHCFWSHCVVLALLVATLGIPADARPIIFNDPTPTQDEVVRAGTKGDSFGFSAAIDATHVLIGAPFDNTNGNDVGEAHLFDATTGNLLRTFNDPTVSEWDRFGYAVALDGNRVLIGANGDDTLGENVGQAYLFSIAHGDYDDDFDVDGWDFLAWQRGDSPSPLSPSDLADWELNFATNTVPMLPSDFDADGDVDGFDFLKWQRGESPNPFSASDLADWETNFGSFTLAATASIPEPSTLLLGALAAVGFLVRRRASRNCFRISTRRLPLHSLLRQPVVAFANLVCGCERST